MGFRLPLPRFTPADLTRLPEALDHDDFIFELRWMASVRWRT